MTRTRSILIVLTLVAAGGCAPNPSRRVVDHSSLYSPDRRTTVWSYRPVVGEGFVRRAVKVGEAVALEGGAVVSFDGERLAINGEAVHARNVVIEPDGQVREGAFVRTFD